MKSTFLQVVDLCRPGEWRHSQSKSTFTVEVESDYIRMGDSRRPTPSHRLNAYCTVNVRVSYGYGYNRGSGRVWVEIFGAGRVWVRVASSATGTGRVAEMVDPHTPNMYPLSPRERHLWQLTDDTRLRTEMGIAKVRQYVTESGLRWQ